MLTWALIVAIWLLMATNLTMAFCVRKIKRVAMMSAWEAGHKVGRASVLGPNAKHADWLRAAGIDPDSLR